MRANPIAQSSAASVGSLSQAKATFLEDVVQGLSQHPKSLPCKYFYDERGSRLFDQICELDEYYLTRTELAIMSDQAAEMGAGLAGPVTMVEFGSGSSLKTRLLLDHTTGPLTYVPVDMSREHLLRSAARLAEQYPTIEVLPVCADFTASFPLPRSRRSTERTVVYFPGSTIGNFAPPDAACLLARIVELCGPGGGLLIGIDLQKDVAILEAAYNDSLGVTADFNLNLLQRINRELQANFDLRGFQHRAEYNKELGRIELYLDSLQDQSVRIGRHAFSFLAGEAICTEYSHKYRVDSFAQLADSVGLKLERTWTDPQQWFAVLQFGIE